MRSYCYGGAYVASILTPMSDQDSSTTQAILTALLASGFPFQTAIAELVQEVSSCKLIAQEFPWKDDTDVGFLDLVITKHNLIVAIECKKTQKDVFTFLQTGDAGKVIRAQCLYLSQIRDSSMRDELFCSDWEIKPSSLESMFCVVSTSATGKDQRMLEKDAQLLIRGADAFGRFVKQNPRELERPERAIVPIIVTNGKLFAARYHPKDVSLEIGQLPATPAPEIRQIQRIRFRKTFTYSAAPVDRTVFVVAASSLKDFLSDLEMISQGPSAKGIHVQ